MILLNGALIINPVSQDILDYVPFTQAQQNLLREIDTQYGISGLQVGISNSKLYYSLPQPTDTWKRYFQKKSSAT